MRNLYIVRHCSAEGQSADASLTAEGRQQAKRLSSFLKDKDIQFIISSPYVRALTSILPLAEVLHLQVRSDARLSERVLSAEPLDNWLDCLKHTFVDFELSYRGGESSQEAMARAANLVNDVLAEHHGNVALVTHGNLMTLLLRYFDERFGFEEWASLTNPDVYVVRIDESQAIVERIWN